MRPSRRRMLRLRLNAIFQARRFTATVQACVARGTVVATSAHTAGRFIYSTLVLTDSEAMSIVWDTITQRRYSTLAHTVTRMEETR